MKSKVLFVGIAFLLAMRGMVLAADTAMNNQDLPFAYLEKLGEKLLEDSKLKAELTRVLGKQRFKEFSSWHFGGIEGRFEDTLVYWDCKPHYCGPKNAALFINLGTGNVQVCWSDNGKEIWLSSKNPPISDVDCNTNQYTWTLPKDYREKDPIAPYRILFKKYGGDQ